jgi:cobalt-zinc-cadmium efflux system protein
MCGAGIIYFTKWYWIDSLIALGIASWILPRTWDIFSKSMNILMESVPDNMNIEELMRSILSIQNIESIHDLHVWSISSDKIILCAHIIINHQKEYESTLESLKLMLAKDYNIHHSTIQVEAKNCRYQD